MPTVTVISDLHLEGRPLSLDQVLDPDLASDVLCLLGDIGDPTSETYRDFLAACAARFPTVLLLAGNNEYRNHHDGGGRTMSQTEDVIRAAAAAHPNVHFLQNQTHVVDDVAFIGTTLWSYLPDDPLPRPEDDGGVGAHATLVQPHAAAPARTLKTAAPAALQAALPAALPVALPAACPAAAGAAAAAAPHSHEAACSPVAATCFSGADDEDAAGSGSGSGSGSGLRQRGRGDSRPVSCSPPVTPLTPPTEAHHSAFAPPASPQSAFRTEAAPTASAVAVLQPQSLLLPPPQASVGGSGVRPERQDSCSLLSLGLRECRARPSSPRPDTLSAASGWAAYAAEAAATVAAVAMAAAAAESAMTGVLAMRRPPPPPPPSLTMAATTAAAGAPARRNGGGVGPLTSVAHSQPPPLSYLMRAQMWSRDGVCAPAGCGGGGAGEPPCQRLRMRHSVSLSSLRPEDPCPPWTFPAEDRSSADGSGGSDSDGASSSSGRGGGSGSASGDDCNSSHSDGGHEDSEEGEEDSGAVSSDSVAGSAPGGRGCRTVAAVQASRCGAEEEGREASGPFMTRGIAGPGSPHASTATLGSDEALPSRDASSALTGRNTSSSSSSSSAVVVMGVLSDGGTSSPQPAAMAPSPTGPPPRPPSLSSSSPLVGDGPAAGDCQQAPAADAATSAPALLARAAEPEPAEATSPGRRHHHHDHHQHRRHQHRQQDHIRHQHTHHNHHHHTNHHSDHHHHHHHHQHRHHHPNPSDAVPQPPAPATIRDFIGATSLDFRRIFATPGGPAINPDVTNALFAASLDYVRVAVAAARARGLTPVVLSHHAPSMRGTCRPQFAGHPSTHAYGTDLESYIESSGIVMWYCGHTHYNFDLELKGGTRLASNQFGSQPQPGEGYSRAWQRRLPSRSSETAARGQELLL